MICDYLMNEHGFKTFFVESVCFDKDIIEANILVSVGSVASGNVVSFKYLYWLVEH